MESPHSFTTSHVEEPNGISNSPLNTLKGMPVNSNSRLGKGFNALINEKRLRPSSDLKELPLNAIETDPQQPRQVFDDSLLSELADSMATHGILEPIVVCPIGNDRYQIIAGERRFRAARRLEWSHIPVVVRDAHAQTNTILALVENLQRSDLHVLEEADAYAQLQRDHGFSQGEIAKHVGKSRPAIANALRLLRLGDLSRSALAAGEIEMGHARALLALQETEEQNESLNAIRSGNWSVRRTENEIKQRLDRKKADQEPLKVVRKVEPICSPELERYFGVEVILKGRQIRLKAKSPADAKIILEKMSQWANQAEGSKA